MYLNAFAQHPPAAEENGRQPFTPPVNTVVAVDRDKNSHQAVKWAVDHLFTNTSVVVLVHVRNPAFISPGFNISDSSPEAAREHIENEMSQLFLPYRGFCARKGVPLMEIVLEDMDITKALVDYILSNNVCNIVVGASSRNALTRKFRNPDVPSSLIRSAPDFCTVYVIYKGKTTIVRSAKTQAPTPAPLPRQSPVPASPIHPASGGTEADEFIRTPLQRGGASPWRGPSPPSGLPERPSFERNNESLRAPGRDRPLSTARTAPNGLLLLESLDAVSRTPRISNSRSSFSDDLDLHVNLGLRSSDLSSLDSHEFSSAVGDSPGSAFSPRASRDVEAEMKRLRLELKQTMDMYSTACKEAITAKQKARELHQWKLEEARKVGEARQAEEAALAMAEIEKAKAKAAIEAAHAAQRLAELEAQKRLSAERNAKREAEEKHKALEALAHNDSRYRKYTIEEIEAATDRFAESLKIGEGGYGPVYRAYLDHTPVAIKVLRPDAAQGRKQFQQEVEVLSCIRHPNMVLLLGACPEYGCLVYEYMDNGSLDDRLCRRGNTPTIPWSIRFKIAAEIATGLLFLHQTKPEPLVHRDLKPGNILLDRNYVSKISDVGLARLVPPSVADSVTQYRVTSTAGTFCYIDPEYQQTGMLGVKSDIYSLGILLLQIVTARPPMGITHHVQKAIEKGAFREMMDPTVADWPEEEALNLAKLALKCAELRRKDRPDLGTVILPELNRLRNLGHGWEITHVAVGGGPSSSSSTGGRSVPRIPHSYANAHPRMRSQTGQDRPASNPNVGTTRKPPRDAVER